MQPHPLDPEAEASRERHATVRRLAEETEKLDYEWLMSSPRGRRIVWDMLAHCGVFRQTFNESQSVAAFNEGRRSVGLRLLASIMQHDHEAYLAMLREGRPDAQGASIGPVRT